MAKLTATRSLKANGEKIIGGYKISLPKIDTEKSGFKAGDELKISFRKGEIRITKK